MSRSFARLLIIIVIAVAAPLKGIASATMLGCLSDTPANARLATADGSAVDGHVHALDHRHAGAAEHGTVEAAHAHHYGSPGSPADAQTKCGTCAPCCAGAALTNTLAQSVMDVPAGADFPTPVSHVPSGRMARLDRPPRAIVA